MTMDKKPENLFVLYDTNLKCSFLQTRVSDVWREAFIRGHPLRTDSLD